MIIASEKAKFGQPEIKVGVFPPIAVIMLPKLIGQKRAFELLLQGEVIDSNEALKIGLINYVFPLDSFDENFNNIINRFHSLSTIIMNYTKAAYKKVVGFDFDSKIDELEGFYLKELMKTHDANEGLQAFLDKRSPNWENH
jgi:cyclohexa-1,5-dienecarbonyl-CoA hydratase